MWTIVTIVLYSYDHCLIWWILRKNITTTSIWVPLVQPTNQSLEYSIWAQYNQSKVVNTKVYYKQIYESYVRWIQHPITVDSSSWASNDLVISNVHLDNDYECVTIWFTRMWGTRRIRFTILKVLLRLWCPQALQAFTLATIALMKGKKVLILASSWNYEQLFPPRRFWDYKIVWFSRRGIYRDGMLNSPHIRFINLFITDFRIDYFTLIVLSLNAIF